MEKRFIAVDLGASSGRVMAGCVNETVEYEEIHRFKNGGKNVDGRLYWDFDSLMSNILQGLEKAGKRYEITSIGIDTWGVDFGLIDEEGKLLRNPVHYRDEATKDVPEKLWEKVSKTELYERTGIQFMRFNTIYQLYLLKTAEPQLWEKTNKILLMPDLIAYMLTGEMRLERTNASTTNILSVKEDGMDAELMQKLGLKNVFAPMIEAGEEYGMVKSELAQKLGIPSVPVVAVCTHDTASAVLAMPESEGFSAFISSGTWSLLGAELTSPNASEKAREAGFTNEIGYNKSVRFLSNIMGLWILQQTKAEYERQGKSIGFGEMEAMAKSVEGNDVFVDVDDSLFELPGSMLERVDEYLAKTNQRPLKTDSEKIRCIYESLALKYAYRLRNLEKIVGKSFDSLRIFGGGSQAKLLSQITANACNLKVICGPCEATAIGNITVQAIRSGMVKNAKEARSIIAKREDIYTADPQEVELWQEKYEKYLKIVKGE